MRERGIQRNFWEGDLLGEGYIYVIKPLMKRGIQQNGILASVLEKKISNTFVKRYDGIQ